ncbi:MAG TPA: hypothetical protein VGF33_03110 [Caulobacteraceae bacterium]|jgi:hypothetical protein
MHDEDRARQRVQFIGRCGEALHGYQWARALANDLRMDERGMRRIRAAFHGAYAFPVGPGLVRDCALLVERRGETVERLLADLAEFIADEPA